MESRIKMNAEKTKPEAEVHQPKKSDHVHDSHAHADITQYQNNNNNNNNSSHNNTDANNSRAENCKSKSKSLVSVPIPTSPDLSRQSTSASILSLSNMAAAEENTDLSNLSAFAVDHLIAVTNP